MADYTDAEIRNFFAWQLEQYNPMFGVKNKDAWNGATVDSLMNSDVAVRGAIEAMDRADRRIALREASGLPSNTVAPWDNPNWQADQAAAEKAEAQRQAAIAAQQSANVTVGPGFVAGPGGQTPAPPPPAAPPPSAPPPSAPPPSAPPPSAPPPSAPPPSAPPTPTVPARIQAIRDWWAANEGQGTQADLNRWLATSGYSAREINQALPQFSIFDLQNAMRTAINDVAQQTPFAPAVPRAINEPYTSVAAQLAPTAASRQQEIQNWLAAYADKGTQADLDRFLASGYTAQEINQAAPQYPVGDLQRAIDAARQAYPTAAYEAALGRYQRGFQPGGQFVGNVSPYALVAQQMQQFQNPYADALANISMGGYTPSLYDVLLQDVVEQSGGGNAEPEIGPGIGPGVGDDSGIGEEGGGEGGGGDGGGMSNSGEGGEGSPGGWAKGGLVDYVTGPNPPGPDDGIGMLQVGEYVIKKSSVDKYGKGLLDMINEGKIPAKKIKSLLD